MSCLVAGAFAPAWAQPARADEPVPALETITVMGHYSNDVGTSDAASEGVVTQRLIANRPAFRPAEVLEFVPGVIVTQHSGDGKANQYFLRGFNLDHGTDFATFVDGMPVNMPSHAHGQGYSDLNFLIPELVQRVEYRKGPYRAQDGDFASAGTARIALLDRLPSQVAQLTVGERGYARALLLGSVATPGTAPGTPPDTASDTLYAVEAGANQGPWSNPERLHKFNSVLRHSVRDGDTRRSLTFMGYAAHWMSSDQIPARAVASGALGRFDAVDPSDGGHTSRASLSYHQLTSLGDGRGGGSWQLNAYAVTSRLNLWSNFTYVLDDSVHGDQFEQAENRRTFGLNVQRTWDLGSAARSEREQALRVGLDLRHDRLSPVGLYTTEQRQRLGVTQASQVRETLAGVWAEHSLQWTPWFRHVVGLRWDALHAQVDSSVAGNSGHSNDNLPSPKLALIFGPWAQTELFANAGLGYHSNDARGSVATVSPREGTPISPVPLLVRSKGGELGLRGNWLAGSQTSLALWRLDLDSELVFVGDAGDTEASRASQRQGVELNQHTDLGQGWLLDLDLAASSARFTTPDPEGDRIPGAVSHVASIGLTRDAGGPWFGHVQWRYFGPRDLTADGSQRSDATALTYLRVGHRFSPALKLSLDVFNVFNQKSSDIDYVYESRLPGEADAVTDRHFHPVEPRTVRLTLSLAFN